MSTHQFGTLARKVYIFAVMERLYGHGSSPLRWAAKKPTQEPANDA